jgi:hypothetical protein
VFDISLSLTKGDIGEFIAYFDRPIFNKDQYNHAHKYAHLYVMSKEDYGYLYEGKELPAPDNIPIVHDDELPF